MSNLDQEPVSWRVQATVEPAGQPIEPRRAAVGESTVVARYFPSRRRTAVGPWCFLDAYGPDDVSGGPGMQVGPHPHIGLQTVTWLFDGEVLHRDSLGNSQLVRPGELNLMTAGAGMTHAEHSPTPHPPWLYGLQLWVALPDIDRSVAPAFAHHPNLPEVELDGATATVVAGHFAGAASPAAVYSALVGAEVRFGTAPALLPLDSTFEHALLVVDGALVIEGRRLERGACAYFGTGRDHLAGAADPLARVMLLGGEPLGEPLVMWWNFVGRTTEEIAEARADWEAGRQFGALPGLEAERMAAPPLPPGRLVPRS